MSNSSSNQLVNPNAREAMDRFKMEAAWRSDGQEDDRSLRERHEVIAQPV